MSDNEEFLARWMRLKHAADTPCNEVAPASAGIDPASLPAVESIDAASDIRLFLESGVPAELVRAALRAAWATDPKIRDFVGIAESQWDFNDPSAMPGFGPLSAMPNTQTVVTPSVALLDSFADAIEGKTQVANPRRDGQVDQVWLSSGGEKTSPRKVEVTGKSPQAADHRENSPRCHGSALPK